MTFRLWKCDPDVSYCIIQYQPLPGSGFTDTITVTGSVSSKWPALASLFGNAMEDHETVTFTTRANAAKQLHDIWEHSDPLIPYQKQVTTSFPLPEERAVSGNFKLAQFNGEVIVNPYAAGSVTRVVESKISTADATLSYAGDGYYGVGSVNPLGITTSSPPSIPGYSCYYCVYMVIFSIKTLTQPTYDVGPSVSLPDTVPGGSIDTAVVTSAVADCNQGTYDLLTEIAELPQTIDFLQGVTARIATIARDHQGEIRRLKQFAHLPAIARKIAAIELGFRYAVMPLVYSIMDVKAVLKDIGRKYAEYRRADEISQPYNWFGFDYSNLAVGEPPKVVHRCFIKAAYTPDTIIHDIIGMIGMNPVATLWEVTPASFIADWVVNFGDFLCALTSTSDADMLRSTYSFRYPACVWTFSADPTNPDLPVTTVTIDSYRRIVINPSDHIGLTFNINMNWKRYLDGGALALQKLMSQIRK